MVPLIVNDLMHYQGISLSIALMKAIFTGLTGNNNIHILTNMPGIRTQL